MSSISVDDLLADDTSKTELDTSATSASVDALATPVLHGLDFDDIRRLLLEKHEVAISKDDPICLMITILNAALDRADTANAEYTERLVKYVDLAVERFKVEINECIKPITEIALNTQISAMLENARQETAQAAKIHASMKRLSIYLGVASSIVGLAAVVNLVLLLSN